MLFLAYRGRAENLQLDRYERFRATF